MKTITYNNNSIEYYDFLHSDLSCTIVFFNKSYEEIMSLFGDNIIDSVTLNDDVLNKTEIIQLNMKVKLCQQESGAISRKSFEVLKESYYSEEPAIDPHTGEPMMDGEGNPIIYQEFHPAEIKTIVNTEHGVLTSVILEPPSINDRVSIISSQVNQQNKLYSTMYDVAQVSAQAFTDGQALLVKNIYPTFNSLVKSNYTAKDVGFKFTYDNELYKTAQPDLLFQQQYQPGVGTESLYTHIDEQHQGTIDDPIPAKTNMEYFKDKYYIEDGVIYLCTSELAKDGIVLQYMPSDLVGNYFEVVIGDNDG